MRNRIKHSPSRAPWIVSVLAGLALIFTGYSGLASASAPTVHTANVAVRADTTLPVPTPTTPSLPNSGRGDTFTAACTDFDSIDVAPCTAALAFDDWASATYNGHPCEQLTSDFAAYYDCSDGYITVESQWVTVSLSAGISVYSSDTPEYTIIHGAVFWRGEIKPTVGTFFAPKVLIEVGTSDEPGDWTPPVLTERQLPGNSAASDVRSQLTAGGVAYIITGATPPAHVDLSGLSGYLNS